jgi:dTMP kinase
MYRYISGKIISIEGIDGCEKDTQVQHVSEYLENKGVEVVVYNFPKYDSAIGRCISDALTSIDYSPYALQLLFSADRAQQFQSVLLYLLLGKVVLIGRFKWSSYVYAVSRGLSRSWAKNIESFVPDSDLTLLLDIDVATSVTRTGGQVVLERNKVWQEQCRQEYLSLAKNARFSL